MANPKLSDVQRTGNTRHLTRIINLLGGIDEALIFADVYYLLGGSKGKVKDALIWLVGNGIVLRVREQTHRKSKVSGKKYRYNAVCYKINPKFWRLKKNGRL